VIKPTIVVLQSVWVEHPVIMEQLTAFLAAPGYGSFTIFSKADSLTHATRQISIEEPKKEKSA
jgi:hypothetical protein